MLLADVRAMTQKKLAAAALAGLLSAGALATIGESAQAQSQGEVVNREVQVTEDRDYTGLWGLLGLLGLAGLAGLRRKKDDSVDVKRSSTNGDVRRGNVRDSEVVSSTGGRNGVDGDRVSVDRGVTNGTDVRKTPGR